MREIALNSVGGCRHFALVACRKTNAVILFFKLKYSCEKLFLVSFVILTVYSAQSSALELLVMKFSTAAWYYRAAVCRSKWQIFTVARPENPIHPSSIAAAEDFQVPTLVLNQLLAHPIASLAANPEWTRYAFMFPVGIIVATCAQTAGIGGAAIMGPFFVLGLPLLGPSYPLQSVAASIATAILCEAFGFSSGGLALQV